MLKFNNRALKYNSRWLNEDEIPDPLNPLNLPPYTFRLLFKDGDNPQYWRISDGYIWSQVSSSPNVWNLTYNNSNWQELFGNNFSNSYTLLKVYGANSTGVINMWRMFENCTYLNEVAIFDTSWVGITSRMFYGCESLTTVPLFNTTNVSKMNDMFSHCYALISVPLFDTSNVTQMMGMFELCSVLTSVPLFDTSNVTITDYMFHGCSSLVSSPLFNTSNVESMQGMFSGCSSLTSIPLFNTNKVINVNNCFARCINVETGILSMYNQLVNQVPSSAYHDGCFYNCGSNTVTGAAELAQIPSDWK